MTINMKNILKGLAVAVCFSTMLNSCTGKFMDYNTNKHEATDEQLEMDNISTGALVSQLQRSVIFFADGTYLDSDYQIMYNLLADSYAGYFAPTGTWEGGKHTGSYFMTESWRRALFANKYVYAMQAAVTLEKTAQEQNLLHVSAMGKILKVASMHQVADYYGPIPYSESGQSLTPSYDALDKVYAQFFEELDSAIETLNSYKNTSSTIFAKYDYVYGGDVVKWIRFANSLRLRLAMRVVYAAPELAQLEAEKSLNDVTGVMTAANESATIQKSAINYIHPVNEINVAFQDGDTQMGASMDVYLNGYSDPRRAIYFKPAADGAFHGVRNGVKTSNWTNYRNAAGKVSAPNALNYSITWLNASEVYFLRAEGALRGWAMGGTAQELYEKGIRTSFEETGATGADTYIANSTAVPAAFTDNVSNASMAALSTVTIAWDEAADFETKLEKIMTQKWLAIFPNSCEAWAEYRRTGYPQLLPVVNNDSAGAVSSDLQIRRVTYPHDEYSNNPAGVASGVAKLGGLDNVGTKLWWDQKPRN